MALDTRVFVSQGEEHVEVGRGLSQQQPLFEQKSTFIVQFQDGKESKSAGGSVGRRGPLKEGGREGMRILKRGGGACWRCKILKKQVGVSESAIRYGVTLIGGSVTVDLPVKDAPL
jgi:hypothetical protein